MDIYNVLDETPADANGLDGQTLKKVRQAGLWMIITAVAGLALFGTASVFFALDVYHYDIEEIAISCFFLCMVVKYALLLMSGVQTRRGGYSSRSHLLLKALFTYRLLWIFVGCLAIVFLVQVILYFTTGIEMFGEITHDMLRE